MFRRPRATLNKRSLRRPSADDDNDDADVGDPGVTNNSVENSNCHHRTNPDSNASSVQPIIQQHKKRRKVLEQAQYKRGVNAEELLRLSGTTGSKKNDDRLDAIEGACLTHISDNQEGILQRKHQQAMEEFIRQNMSKEVEDKQTNPTETLRVDHHELLTEQQLYQRLAETSRQLTGKSTLVNDSAPVDDGAKEAFVAGTGLAEVILPVEERLKTLKETAVAAMALEQQRYKKGRRDETLLPTYSSRDPKAGAVPQRFASTRHSHTTGHAATNESSQVSASTSDSHRLGFDAFRQKSQRGPTPDARQNTRERIERATDDRAFKNFVTHHRERRFNR